MNQGLEHYKQLFERATANANRQRQQQRIVELVGLIDELSGEMGSGDFRTAVRLHGYDIDACLLTLGQRGVNYTN